MSGNDRKKLPVTRPGATYEVGYGKPPKAHRFKKGQSGNPRGRPKGAKNKVPALNAERLKTIVLEEAYRDITVRDGDRMVSVPMARAVVRAMAVNAAKGQHRAQRLFSELLAATERANKALADEWLETAITYKVEWDRELDRRARLGITDLPPPLPHPDHVIIDMRDGTARVTGPMTKEEKAELEMWRARKAAFEAEREELQQLIGDEDDEKTKAFMMEELARTQEVLDLIDPILPPEV